MKPEAAECGHCESGGHTRLLVKKATKPKERWQKGTGRPAAKKEVNFGY